MPSTVTAARLHHLGAVDDFSDTLELLAAEPTPDPILGYSQASSALYTINTLARSLELSGLQPDQIIEAFTRIRRVFAASPLGHHMQTWPNGYQGDFGAVEYIAAGINRAQPATFAFNLERAMLHSGIVQQHRYKLRCQTEAFLRALAEQQLRPRMLSVGCGGCRDLLPLLPALHHFKGNLILNDIDPAALEFARKRLSPATNRFQMLCANVLKAIRLLRSEKPFNLVVAGGLFDYIPDRLLTLVVNTVFNHLLAPGGTFLFTNIADGNLFRPLMSYAVNWRLIERSETLIRDLCQASSVPEGCFEIERDESQLTCIVRLRRPTST